MNMPINVFGNSSSSLDNGNKTDTVLFVQILYLRNIYIESNIEEDTDMKNQHRVKNPKDQMSIRDAASKNFFETFFKDPSIIKNACNVDFKMLNIFCFLNIDLSIFDNDRELLKIRNRDDQLRELQYKIEKHDYEKNFKIS